MQITYETRVLRSSNREPSSKSELLGEPSINIFPFSDLSDLSEFRSVLLDKDSKLPIGDVSSASLLSNLRPLKSWIFIFWLSAQIGPSYTMFISLAKI